MTIDITPAPTLPSLSDPANFNAQALALFQWMTQTFINELEGITGQDIITDLGGAVAVNIGGTGATTPAGARSNLGAQAQDADLDAIAALTPNESDFLTYRSGAWTNQQGLSGSNLIINGSGRINQRGYVSGTATTGANQFTLDRWFVVTSGQSLTFTGDASARVMTAPAGGVRQVIAGEEITGGTYVLNWEGTATAEVNGTARTKGETFTLTANTNAVVAFSSGTFTNVQLEKGSVPTTFERREVGEELRKCQRFYCIVDGEYKHDGALGGAVIGVGFMFPYPVTMRSAPTLSVLVENAIEANPVSTLTDKSAGGAFVAWGWTNGTIAVARTKQVTLQASAELTS